MKINGDAEELPYENAQNVSFSRLYMDGPTLACPKMIFKRMSEVMNCALI